MPEEDNPMELWLGRALSARLDSQVRRSLRQCLEASRAAAIPIGKPDILAQSQSSQVYRDRQGEAMQELGAVDFATLPRSDVTALAGLPNSGRLTIFCSPQILSLPAKDRRNFKLAFTQQQDGQSVKARENILPLTIDEGSRVLLNKMDELGINSLFREEICAAAKAYNKAQAGENYLLGAPLAGGDEDLQVCAFASGGISYNSARASDPHYAHLVEEAKQWRLLARLRETGALSQVKEARLYMRPQDLIEGLFDRAWLLCK